jgi:hypothetical protein
MKKSQLKYALLLLLTAIPAFMISCNKDEDVKLDFELTVPENWSYLVLANEGWIYSAGRKPVDNMDTITEGLYIFKQKLPQRTLEEYYMAIKDDITDFDTYDETLYESDTVINYTNFVKLISREFIPYINTVYNDTIEINAITERYFFYENSYGYNFTFTTVDTLYNENKAVFKQIMSTFQYPY